MGDFCQVLFPCGVEFFKHGGAVNFSRVVGVDLPPPSSSTLIISVTLSRKEYAISTKGERAMKLEDFPEHTMSKIHLL